MNSGKKLPLPNFGLTKLFFLGSLLEILVKTLYLMYAFHEHIVFLSKQLLLF